MVDRFKQKIDNIEKTLLELNDNQDEEVVRMTNLLSDIKKDYPDLYEYLLLKSMKENTNKHNMNHNYFSALHQVLKLLMEVNEKGENNKKDIENLQDYQKTIRNYRFIIGGMIVIGIFFILWLMSMVDSEATDKALNVFERLSRIFSIFGGS